MWRGKGRFWLGICRGWCGVDLGLEPEWCGLGPFGCKSRSWTGLGL